VKQYRQVTARTTEHFEAKLNLEAQSGWELIRYDFTDGVFAGIMERKTRWTAPWLAVCKTEEEKALMEALLASAEAVVDRRAEWSERQKRVRELLKGHLKGRA
jgi:hypothetical protein